MHSAFSFILRASSWVAGTDLADKREIQRQIDRIPEVLSKKPAPYYPAEFEPWRAQTERVLAEIFGDKSLQLAQFKRIQYGPVIVSTSDSDAIFVDYFIRGLSEAKILLASFLEDLDESIGGREKNRLVCPKCQSVEVDYLELRPAGDTELKGGIHFLGGRKRNIKTLAYYRCRICNNVFSVEPTKSEEQKPAR